MDRGAWRATAHRVADETLLEQLSMNACILIYIYIYVYIYIHIYLYLYIPLIPLF